MYFNTKSCHNSSISSFILKLGVNGTGKAAMYWEMLGQQVQPPTVRSARSWVEFPFLMIESHVGMLLNVCIR